MNLLNKYFDVLHQKAQINIGKRVDSEGVIDHIMKMLKKDKIIKIHALKSALTERNITELAEDINAKTKSYLLDIRGHTFIISKSNIDIRGTKNNKD